MIRYALVCEAGHEFESWFRDYATSEQQVAGGQVACPICGSPKVSKGIMAPEVGAATRADEPAPQSAQPVALLSEHDKETRRMLKELRQRVTENADYVGEKFPDLARQMHHEEIEHRSIYGEAKPDEVRSLIEEGVEVQPLPILPEDKN